MSDVCQTSISPELYAQLATSEFVTVREYERDDGTRFANVIGAGTEGEMDSLVGTPGLLLVMSGLNYVGDRVVPVAELLPPQDEFCEGTNERNLDG